MENITLKQILIRIIRNKYVISFLIFYVWLFFFDQHSIVDRYENEDKIEKLQKQKDYYLKKIETDHNRIHELKTNRKNLEKFAREQYLMKKPNEDIFIVIEDD